MTHSGKPFVFFAIAFGLALLVRWSVPVLGELSLVVTMLTPAFAAMIMLILVAPEGSFRQVMAGLGLANPGFKAWPLAIGGPALIHVAGLAILAAAGLSVIVAPEISGSSGQVLFRTLTGLAAGILFAMCEEVGWRGYMLPRMKASSPIGAMLIVGLLHGIWHLPLLLTTDYYHSTGDPWLVTPLFLTTLTLAGVFYGFLRIWTGSVWPVAVAHASANMAWDISSEVSQTKSPMVLEYIGGESGLIVIGGLLILDVLLIMVMSRNKDVIRTT